MGIVTRSAVPDFRVNMGRPEINRVALQAKLGLVFLEPQHSDQTVRLVTGSAVAALKGVMGKAKALPHVFVTSLAGPARFEPAASLELGSC